MLQMIEANWLIFVAALLVGMAVAYWLFAHSARPARRERRPDVLDEGATPAQRNQALIDAPPAAAFDAAPHIDPPAMAGTMAGIGEVIAVAAQEEVDNLAPPEGDDLSRIKGLGPKLRALLPTLGITRFDQIAALTDADLDELDGKLGAFAGRPRKDSWVEQARLLAAGDTAGYEEKFGKL